jgi:hypothetical protein
MAAGRLIFLVMVAFVGAACGDRDDAATGSGASSAAAGSSNAGGASSGTGSTSGGSSSSAGSSTTGAGQSGGGASSAGGSAVGGSAGASNGVVSYTGPGTITDLWRDFCIATLTEDHAVTDDFGTPLFTAKAGEEYLLLYYPEPYASAHAAYLTSGGPLEFGIKPNADHTAFPFTSNCPTDPPGSYFAAFADVSVYAEPELVTKICDLKAGDAVPRDIAANAGYALETPGMGTSIYEIFLNAFSAQCGGAASGYVSVSRIRLFGSDRALVPFKPILADN